jgi:hypothetical protein
MAENDNTPRPDNRETEYEMEKPGRPPRPATEPKGSERSSKNSKTITDPATGAPNPHAPD